MHLTALFYVYTWNMIYSLIFLLFGNFKATKPAFNTLETNADSLKISVMNYDQLKPLLNLSNDTTYVVNFWATWCAPCVKELPYFVSLDSLHKEEPFRLILVSLDFKKDYVSKLQPFVEERALSDYVVILEDNRMNYWIDDIEKSWSGAIPATLVYSGEKRKFFERTFHDLDELSDVIKPFLN